MLKDLARNNKKCYNSRLYFFNTTFIALLYIKSPSKNENNKTTRGFNYECRLLISFT